MEISALATFRLVLLTIISKNQKSVCKLDWFYNNSIHMMPLQL
jgi:hypothetical protein